MNVVSFDPWNPGVAIAGGDDSGIFRSADDGKTWSVANVGISGINQLQVATIAFSPDVHGEVYAGVGYQGTNGGLLVSTDDGLTWSLRSSVPEFSGSINKDVAGLPEAHPRSTGALIQVGTHGLLYAATFKDGVMRSVNDGVDWTPLALAGQHLRALAMDPTNPDVLFASTYGAGVWKTTTASTTGTFTKLAASPVTVEDLTFVGTDLYAVGPDGLSRSSDAGVSWTPLGVGQLPTGGTGPPSSTPTWFTATGYQSCGKTVLYVGGQFKGAASVMVSTDGGAHWAAVSDPTVAQVHSTEGDSSGPTWWLAGNSLGAFGGSSYVTSQIAVDPTYAPDGCNRQRILVSGRAGIFGTVDAGANWYPMMSGLGVTVIRGIAADPNVAGRVYLAPADWGSISSTDDGVSVTQNAPAGVFDAFGVAVDPSTTPSTVYLATGKFPSGAGEIWSNPDPASGTAWTSEGLGSGSAAGGLRPVGLAVNRVSGSPVILATVQSSGIWRKAAGTWTRVNTAVVGGAQSSFSWIPGSSTVYLYDHSTGVWRSTDAGQNWTEIWVQHSPEDMTGYVAADPTDPSRLYVSVDAAGIYRLDGADVGTVLGGQIVPKLIGTLSAPGAIAVRSDGALYAVELPSAIDGPAIFSSTDQGTSWSTISDASYAATGGFVRTLSVGPDGALWAGLYGDGMTMLPGPSYALTVNAAGNGGGSVSSTPAGITCPSTCSASFTWGSAVSLSAVPDASSTFTGWSGSGCSGTGTCAVTMTAAHSVTATFTLKTFVLQASKAGTGTGVVTSNPAGISCGASCQASFNHNTPVTLTEAPGASSSFTGWSGACSGTGTCQVTMNQAQSVTATFSGAYQPDGLLAHGSGAFVGNGVYSSTGAGETVAVNSPRGKTVTFRWKVQNDGALSDRIAFKGAGSSNGFSLTFLLGTSNVTKAVVAGTYTKSLAPGASLTITVTIKVAATATIGAVRSELLNASSTIQPAAKDKVLAQVTVTR